MALNSINYDPLDSIQGAGIMRGSGAPTSITAQKGTLYVNLTASSTTTRLYINTDGSTTWGAFTASA
ncbi:hypothetical protein E6Q11_03130 [Candidatus Dojkabacteria bacterium]|uniref:Uncharacterized protein n=1 Tax=Candidatus Dojkabacteria bacterium TaxID=2099670 RepID=A0A5C7J6K5_9BACT|nr:MAG: hypothetical protein E6Q11_03130 [Candidatus Dojkabacteria bacterium]